MRWARRAPTWKATWCSRSIRCSAGSRRVASPNCCAAWKPPRSNGSPRRPSTFPAAATRTEIAAEMRYDGQGYDVTVPLDRAWLAEGDTARISAAFHAAHRATYGHANEAAQIWLKELRAHVVGEMPKPRLAPLLAPISSASRRDAPGSPARPDLLRRGHRSLRDGCGRYHRRAGDHQPDGHDNAGSPRLAGTPHRRRRTRPGTHRARRKSQRNDGCHRSSGRNQRRDLRQPVQGHRR